MPKHEAYVPGVIFLVYDSSTADSPCTADRTCVYVDQSLPCQIECMDLDDELRGPSRDGHERVFHLGHIMAFAHELNSKLSAIGFNTSAIDDDDDNQSDSTEPSTRIYIRVPPRPVQRAIAVCLLGCWAILHRKWTATRALEPLQENEASVSKTAMLQSVFQLLCGFEKAVLHGFIRGDASDVSTTPIGRGERLSWITPCMALLACKPAMSQQSSRCGCTSDLHGQQVDAVVRLVASSVGPDDCFKDAGGIRVVDVVLSKSPCPSQGLIHSFLDVVKGKRIVVHSTEGHDTVSLLVASHLMDRYSFSTGEALGWLKLCYPKAVINSSGQDLLDWLRSTLGRRSDPRKAKGMQRATPETPEQDAHNIKHGHPIKGIAKRGCPLPVSCPQNNEPSCKSHHKPALPPKIPGWRGLQINASAPTTPTRGDSLLQRKQLHPPSINLLPLGVSLWSLSSSNED